MNRAPDVCVIGAGPAGLAAATALAATGREVLVLERGGHRVGWRADNRFEDAGVPAGPAGIVRRFAAGGSGRVWGRTLVRLDESDLPATSWREDGWPITAADLDPWYLRAEQVMHAQPSPHPRTELGDLTLVPLSRSDLVFPLPGPAPASLQVALRHRVTGLETANGAVRRIHGVSRRGGRFTVTAGQVVLAAGAVENAMVLFASDLGGDTVGRWFADHPQILIPLGRPLAELAGRIPEGLIHPPRAAWALSSAARADGSLPGAAAYLVPWRDPRLWERPGVVAAGVLFHALYHRDLPVHPVRTAARAVRSLPDLVRVARSRRSPAVAALRVMIETAPDPDSRVTPGAARDRHGMPVPRIDWRVGPRSGWALQRLLGAISVHADQAGWGPIHLPADPGWPGRITPGAHHMGTTRMATDPARGVVDRNGQVFGVANLFVTGPSVFPGYGWANPMLTGLALALRLSNHLAD